MRALILNREGNIPSDNWYQIEVAGKHPAGDKREQLIDAIAMESIVNRFKTESAKPNFAGMLVDNDHLSHDLTQSTEALAWAKELEIRDGQLHARLDLTDIGEPAIRNKRFKFFSTEYDPEDLQDLGNGIVRPLRLAGLAFTNRPNNRGAKPISNRGGVTHPTTETTMQPIAIKLGLDPAASEAEILAAIDTLMKKCSECDTKEAGAQADAIMNRLGNRVPEAVRPMWREKLVTNREETEKLMDASFPVVPAAQVTRIHNRETANAPAAVTDAEKSADAKTAAAIRNRAGQIQKAEGIPFNQAFSRAQAELR